MLKTEKCPRLNLPNYNFKFGQREGKKTIWDFVRKKYIILTPEEWVRQNMAHFLHHQFHYPVSLMAIETELKVNRLKRRTDLVCYSNSGSPILLVECKAPYVQLNQKTFDQAARYNISLNVPYLIITNGLHHYCAQIDWHAASYEFMETIPAYENV